MPWLALLALAMTGFVVMMTETLPAGLLPSIAEDFSVSQGAAGQLVSFYAIGPVIATIPAMIFTRRLPRRPLLLVTLLVFLMANTLTGLAWNYEISLVARLIAGVCSGVVWGMIAGYARRIVPHALSGRALAVALIGTPVALSFGTPLATFLGSIVGWRWTFGAMSALTLLLLGWIMASLPNVPGASAESGVPVRRVLKIPGIVSILAVTVGWMLAHNLLYTYIAPFIESTGTGLRTDVVLLIFGVSAIGGIWVTGILVDRGLRLLVLGSLALFAVSMVLLAVSSASSAAIIAAIIVWGLTFGGAPTLLQTANGDAAGANGDIAQAVLVTGWNLAIFIAGTVGGLLLEGLGTASLPPAALLLIVLSTIVAIASRTHAFKPGTRHPAA
ncbi:MFS transporter [Arthrobacter sp. ERGS1:01]|nr:MFS transporter [Arthrobacter sp. ERGS1:01]